ncbi:MAG: outer membrane transport energization protein ExbD [Bacteroidetes bacterium HLUCCA01]|nr:MAG: outer membrane transport energization protein ExbD [Bacteroidetes bacterium HLUCCA01]
MNFRDDQEKRKPLALFTQSSLTDIVLLLLIFFLLTSSFVTNFAIRVNVPQADSQTTTERRHISVTVTAEGTYYVAGDLTPRAQLSTKIREEYRDNPQSTLVLRADKDAKVDDAVRVMNIAKALNLNIMMATEMGSQ